MNDETMTTTRQRARADAQEDREELRRFVSVVSHNLINNSIDALSDAQRRSIRIELRDLEEQAVVSVADSGPGIDEEIAEKVMTPFFTTKPKGTGIGLSLSRSIARRHGGDLVLETAGKNTSFRLELPKTRKLDVGQSLDDRG